MRALRAVLIGATMLVFATSIEAQQSGFVIVVHAENPIGELSREMASRLFLKKVDGWTNGGIVAPIDLTESSPTREAFSKVVHKRSVGAIKAFWQQQLFAAKDIPPLEKTTEAEVLAYVRANPNAIGYVAAGVPLGSGVKTVQLRP